jgi:tRNA uridine 5-carbamoylmethylation protein Kti12
MKLIIFCGISGSGKTTKSREIFNDYNALRLSFDEMHCFQHNELIPHILKALMDGNNVVVDSLYIERWQRVELLSAVAGIGCEKILVVINTPLDECLKRNQNREVRLPDFVLHDLYNKFEFPTLDEGWDEILYY